jgi:hypothetical protein
LSRIFEILSDTAAKAVYDNLRKARRKQIERNEALDAKRRKIKEGQPTNYCSGGNSSGLCLKILKGERIRTSMMNMQQSRNWKMR